MLEYRIASRSKEVLLKFGFIWSSYVAIRFEKYENLKFYMARGQGGGAILTPDFWQALKQNLHTSVT